MSEDRQATPLPGELGPRELARWSWRQLTSMRTALVLLLLLALAAIPGSVVPQEDLDSLAVSQWKDDHPRLAPIWERLDLFSVYSSPWFSAIYILLMISLVGCILPRTAVYWRALRVRPPRAPRHLARLPQHTSYVVDAAPEEVLERAAGVLRRRRFRVVVDDDAVAAEKGRLREAGNLIFHVAVLVVLVGFAVGGLYGYKGGAILVVGNGFTNNLTSYDDFAPGSLFDVSAMEPFAFDIEGFDATWLTEGPSAGQARGFVSHLAYTTARGEEPREYDLRVNHPLSIGGTDIFLIGHGYAPVITIRDANGDIAKKGPTVFLPTGPTFESFGVVKAPYAEPTGIALEGTFYPTFVMGRDENGELSMPRSEFGDAFNPLVSLWVYTGDVGAGSSVYVLDKSGAELVTKADGQPFRLDMRPGDTVELPDGLGSVTFEGVERWNKIQISRTPGKLVALSGVVLALLGLLASLFVRPRRVWVRASAQEGGGTLVEVARLDRSSGADPAEGDELSDIVADLRPQKENP